MVRRLIKKKNVRTLKGENAKDDTRLQPITHRLHRIRLPRPRDPVLTQRAPPLLELRHALKGVWKREGGGGGKNNKYNIKHID